MENKNSNGLQDETDGNEKPVQNKIENVPEKANTYTSNAYGDLAINTHLLNAQLIIVSGMQGSGKTTKARSVQEWLEQNMKRVEVIPPLEFMASGNYIDLFQPDDKKGVDRRENVVDRLKEAHNQIINKQLDVVIIVYSLDTISARKKLGYEIKQLKINGRNIVEYYADTDPYLALIMGVSALPDRYTVQKHLTSMSKYDKCNPADDTSIPRAMIKKFAIDIDDNDLDERLQKICKKAPWQYKLLYYQLKDQSNYARKIKKLIEKQKTSTNELESMTDMFTKSSIHEKNETAPSSTTNKVTTATASNSFDSGIDNNEPYAE